MEINKEMAIKMVRNYKRYSDSATDKRIYEEQKLAIDYMVENNKMVDELVKQLVGLPYLRVL